MLYYYNMQKNSKYPDIQSLRGVAGALKKPLSFKEMREIYSYDRDFDKFAGIKRKEP